MYAHRRESSFQKVDTYLHEKLRSTEVVGCVFCIPSSMFYIRFVEFIRILEDPWRHFPPYEVPAYYLNLELFTIETDKTSGHSVTSKFDIPVDSPLLGTSTTQKIFYEKSKKVPR